VRPRRLYATTLAGLTATAGGLALGYPVPFVVVVAIVAFGLALWGIAEPVFDDDYRVASGGLVLGDLAIACLWVVWSWAGLLLAYVTVVLAGFLVRRRPRHAERAQESQTVTQSGIPASSTGSEGDGDGDGVSRSAHSSALDIAGLALAASLLIHGLAVSGLQVLYVVLGCVILVLLGIGWSLPRNREPHRQRWLTPPELVQVGRRYASQGPLRRLHAVGWVLFSLFASLRFVILLSEREWARAVAEFLVMIFWVAIAEHYCADVELQPAPTADED
jgi:hypothetical protein